MATPTPTKAARPEPEQPLLTPALEPAPGCFLPPVRVTEVLQYARTSRQSLPGARKGE